MKEQKIRKHVTSQGVNSNELLGKLCRIQRCLSPNLLKPQYRKIIERDCINVIVWGHCYVATEAAYYLFARDLGYVPYMVKTEDGTHWWLEHPGTGKILDPTYPQISDKSLYQTGHHASFLTQNPSKRCQELIRRICA